MALTLKQALALFWEQIQIRFVKREHGKGLSTNDFTTEEKNKLAAIQEGAGTNVQADWNVTDETSDAFIKNKPVPDSTLTIEGAAADAKTVGDLWRAVADDNDVIWILAQLGLVQKLADETGAILTDEVGNILLL